MTIKVYNDGDHPGYFIGVLVTLSVNGKVRQQYFNFRHPNRTLVSLEEENTLRQQAHDLHEQWLSERKPKVRNPYCGIKNDRIDIYGMTCEITVDHKYYSDQWRYYYTPCFMVKIPQSSSKRFYITLHGYQGAFEKAVDYYIQLHQLRRQRKKLLSRIPDRAIFIDLILRLRQRGRVIPDDKINQWGL